MQLRLGVLGTIVATTAMPTSAAQPLPSPNGLGSAPIEAFCYPPDTTPGRGLVAKATRASPPSPEVSRLVDRFLAAAATGDTRGLTAVASPKWPATEQTRSCVTAIAKVAPECSQLPFYLLDNGEIRVDWACGPMVSYSMFFTTGGGKVTNLWSADATDRFDVARLSNPLRNSLFAVIGDEQPNGPGKAFLLPEERPEQVPEPKLSDAGRAASEKLIARLLKPDTADAAVAASLDVIDGRNDSIKRVRVSVERAAHSLTDCAPWRAEDLGLEPASAREFFLIRLFCKQPVMGWTRVYIVIGTDDAVPKTVHLNQGSLVRVWKQAGSRR